MNAFLQVNHISCQKGQPPAVVLHEITFRLHSGELVALVGPSGCGKSTLLRVLAGLDPNMEGQILFQGKTLHEWRVCEWRRRMGLVFQLPFLFNGTVMDNLLYGPWLHQQNRQNPLDESAEAAHWLNQVGLPKELLHRPAHQLSVGQQMRVSLARTLANRPKLLLLDEPTASLDKDSAWQILRLIQQLNRDGLAILIATHQLPLVQELPCRVLRMQQGRLVKADNKNSGAYSKWEASHG